LYQDYQYSAMCPVNNDAVLAEVDETRSYVQPLFVLDLETLDVAR